MFEEIVTRTHSIPLVVEKTTIENGESTARQLDIALMAFGFKLSKEALQYFSSLHPILTKDVGRRIMGAVKKSLGAHVSHNTYFKDFPKNVPDTQEFWTQCIVDALSKTDSADKIQFQLASGMVNLLDLPKYGKYQHSYQEMVDAHDQFISSFKDRVTVLHLGKTLKEETLNLYYQLASSTVPLNEEDRKLLLNLAEICMDSNQPDTIPIRENKALINKIRLENKKAINANTVTDVLRLACALSNGDVTLETKTNFTSFKRAVRKTLLAELNRLVETSREKLGDVHVYAEEWKRLGERLHPYEYELKHAQELFAVARGDEKFPSLMSKAEAAFAKKNIPMAIDILSNSPGLLIRSLDRIFCAASIDEATILFFKLKEVLPKVSGRVILSLREYAQNRLGNPKKRIFANSKGTAWVKDNNVSPLSETVVNTLLKMIDDEIFNRLPEIEHLVIDEEVTSVALPMSEKNKSSGFGIVPRGSVFPVKNDNLRFFMYWKEKETRTDYDLSMFMLDENFNYVGQVSWTNLRDGNVVHSGDITSAPKGASEFIDIKLNKVNYHYIIPQVNVFCGEDYNEVEEAFFGFMERGEKQKGLPYEPKTVRVKSDLRGKGKVALPIVFMKNDNGNWEGKWLHMYMKGNANFNRVEKNKVNANLIAKTILERKYLTVVWMTDLLAKKAKTVSVFSEEMKFDRPVTFIGLNRPQGLPKDSKTYTISNLIELIPA